MSTTVDIDSFLGQIVAETRFLVHSHLMQKPLPPSGFSNLISGELPQGLNPSQDASFAKSRKIIDQAKSTLPPGDFKKFAETIQKVVDTANRMIAPPEPSFAAVIECFYAHGLIQKGSLTFDQALQLSPQDLHNLDMLHYDVKQNLEKGNITVIEALKIGERYEKMSLEQKSSLASCDKGNVRALLDVRL